MGRVVFVPAPTGGLNARDPVLLMPETDAQTLDNMVCEPGYVRNKGGSTLFCTMASRKTYGLVSMRTATGSEKFLSLGSGGSLNMFQSIETGTAVDRSTTYYATSTPVFPVWDTCVYRNRIFGCNSVDRPFSWDGSSDVAIAGWTGPADVKKLQTVQPYRSRLYFTEYQTASYWYTASVDNITGALIEVPIGSLLHFGGTPIFAGSSSNRQGDTSQELFVIYSSEGEVLIYSGRYPADSSWQIVKRCRIAKPYYSNGGARVTTYVDADLYLLTRAGPVGISELLSGADFNDPMQIGSGKVRQLFLDAWNNKAISTTIQDDTWSATYHQAKGYIVFNVHTPTDSLLYQFVLNKNTGAWSRWTDISALSWGTYNDKLYYGISGGVYEADVRFGATPAAYAIKHAYSFLDKPQANKKVTLMQPLITVEKSSGSEATDTLTYGMDSDLESPTALNDMSFQVTSSTAKLNKPVMPLTAYGKALALRLEDAPSTGYDVRYYGSWVQVEDAGGLT